MKNPQRVEGVPPSNRGQDARDIKTGLNEFIGVDCAGSG